MKDKERVLKKTRRKKEKEKETMTKNRKWDLKGGQYGRYNNGEKR